jgi:hypothetical protein
MSKGNTSRQNGAEAKYKQEQPVEQRTPTQPNSVANHGKYCHIDTRRGDDSLGPEWTVGKSATLRCHGPSRHLLTSCHQHPPEAPLHSKECDRACLNGVYTNSCKTKPVLAHLISWIRPIHPRVHYRHLYPATKHCHYVAAFKPLDECWCDARAHKRP